MRNLIKFLRLGELKRSFFALLYKTNCDHRHYFYFKWHNINRALHNAELLTIFRDNLELPDNYGVGIDERIVEYPWTFSHLKIGHEKLLDAGSTFNFEPIVRHKLIKAKDLTIMTLEPEAVNFTRKNLKYIYGDLRLIPFADNCFDTIACMSTLEHIGMDNSKYLSQDKARVEGHKENNPRSFLAAITEFERVLRPGGMLLITVPFGRYKDHKFFQQFDSGMVKNIIETFGGTGPSVDFYKYSRNGWQISDQDSCNDTEFSNGRGKKPNPDVAASAGAVACIKLIK